MAILTVYARKEPTTDEATLKYFPNEAHGAEDVVIYRESGEFFCRFPWYVKSKPRRNQKTVALNCYCWRLIWK